MTSSPIDIAAVLSALPVVGVGASGRFGIEPDPIALAEASGGPSFIEYAGAVDHRLYGDALERLEDLEKPALYRSNGLNLSGPYPNPAPWVAAVYEHARAAGSPWVSQAVGTCFVGDTPGQDVHLGALVPPVLTRDSLNEAVDRVMEVRPTLHVPLLLEPSLATFVAGDIDIFSWLGELAVRTGSGLLLDAGHVVSHQLAAGRDLIDGLDALPWPRVVAVRLGGGLIETHEGRRYYQNGYDLPIQPEAWELFEHLLDHCPNLKAVIVGCEGAIAQAVLPTLKRTRQRVALMARSEALRMKALSELAS